MSTQSPLSVGELEVVVVKVTMQLQEQVVVEVVHTQKYSLM
jgi:hypothetical protein